MKSINFNIESENMATPLNYKHPTFFEGLVSANVSPDPAQTLRELIQADSRWTALLGYAMNPTFKMVLAEGKPPYKETEFPEGLADYELLHLHDKLYVFFNKDANLRKAEEIFIRHLESMTPDEAELLIAIKDKTLHKQFPNVGEYEIVASLGWKRETYDNMKDKDSK